jgi:hopanoid biosynthesis associated RND transporter like protein HpnN
MKAAGAVGGLIARWTALVCRAPRAVALVALVLVLALVPYVAATLHMRTDTTDIISDQLPSRQDYIDFRNAFPQLVGSLIVVIDGATPEQADEARARLASKLADDADRFPWVYAPGGDEFFARNGLLYLDLDALESLSDRLARVQPVLGPLARDTSLHGLAAAFDLVARAPSDADLAEATAVLEALDAAFVAAAADRFHRVAWSSLLGASEAEDVQRLLLVQPRLDTGSLAPARRAIDGVREAAREAGIDAAHGLRVRLTGPVALEHEELLSVARGAALASGLALVLVAVVLGYGLGSARLVLASLATLLAGLVATAAFAAVAVGSLNLISIAFIVLYIGLGIDYAVHWTLRYRELREHGTAQVEAIRTAARDVGSSLLLAAFTSSIGFFAFYPTTFRGVSELGLISGTGMWIALVLTLSLLPALLTLWPFEPSPRERRWTALPIAPKLPTRTVAIVAFLLALGAALLLPRVRFDSNPLNLRASGSESVTTYRELLEDPDRSPLTLAWVAPDLDAARSAAAQVRALPSVARALTIESLVPRDQEDKLAVIDDLRLLMGPTFAAGAASDAARGDTGADLATLDTSLRNLARSGFAGASEASTALATLRAQLDTLPESERERRLSRLEESVLSGLRYQLDRLRASLQARAVTARDLPPELASLWRSADGRYRVEIAPSEDLAAADASARFVEQVRSVLPHATGLPVIQQEAGRSVVHAFRQAFITALVAISILTWMLMRDLRDALLVLTPVLLGTLLTVGMTVLLDMPFNFANVIALPLLLGICVDNGVHIVHRHRSGTTPDGVLASSTARAVVVSALATVATFGGLAFSGHPGMASMGKLLTIGLAIGLACSLITLPALLEWRDAPRGGGGAS